ncbi:sugar/nucleoside kinase (ribokinase family) [Bradyrhizobium sp. USDA 4469]
MGRVFVAGSINMDVVATADRHPKVGETVAGRQVLYFPGGKGANQAVASARLGVKTTLIGRLGKDAFGAELRAFLGDQGIDLGGVREADTHSGTAIITVASSDNTIVVIPGSNALVSVDDVADAPLAKGVMSRSASSRFRCRRLPRSSSGRVPPGPRRCSIRHRRKRCPASCSRWSTSSC